MTAGDFSGFLDLLVDIVVGGGYAAIYGGDGDIGGDEGSG